MSKILLIEDTVQDCTLFADCLTDEGYQVLQAEHGKLGIDLAHEWAPDLILCDISLPGLNGYDVLTHVRQDTRLATTVFIFITGRSSYAEIRQGMGLGADDYLIKPCSIEELLRAITTRLQKQQKILELVDPRRLNQSPAPQHLPLCYPQLSLVFNFIEAHFCEQISLKDVALHVGYSPAYLTTLMQRETGRTVNCWIAEYRMAQARSLLLKANLSINEVATHAGFLDTCHFIRKFRQYHKTTPKAWRDARRTP